jgi:hypothetical protein
LYEQLARGVAADPELLALLAELPPVKTQPNLFFAAARYVGGTAKSFDDFRAGVLHRRDDVLSVMRAKLTQTNEPARCTALYPLLASLPQPLALVEVGASAGLCLYPDRYRYDYGYAVAGDIESELTLTCSVDGQIRPDPGSIEVVWRAGIDLNPLDVTHDEHVAWLETLIWPEHDDRLARMRAAIEIARADPVSIVAGDLLEQIEAVTDEAPEQATLVVFHTAVLNYVDADAGEAFADLMLTTRGHWISQEAPRVVERVSRCLGEPAPQGMFVMALDGKPIAFTAPHGGRIRWLEDLR